MVFSFRTITLATKTIKNGFTSSIGWNFGKKGKSIHRLDPLISTPKIGIKKRNKMEIKNKNGKYFISLFFSWIEIAKIKNNEIKTKIRCLMKKKYVCERENTKN